ncbi:adenylate kinase family protein [Striga asiatica]|uniref:Adenylate kinase family protein n=1 Tax=Striga asiatica TaxID=4170 RepID=A0A5A7PMG5_STRAF|nr:adenylate kinase family protein [Striga asiatica]
MIFGNKESNKVSEQQVFILWSISHDKSVSMLQYLKESLFDVRNDSRRGPTLVHVVSMLVEYFGVQIDEPKILAKWISQKDLYHASFLIDDTTPKPVTQRNSYKAYLKEMGLPLSDDQSQPAAGTSIGPAPEASHDVDGEDLEANAQPEHDTYQPPSAMDEQSSASSQRAPVWFSEYRARNDEQLRAIHSEVSSHNVRLES